MYFIKHRANSISELHDLHPQWGAEIDLRSDCHRPNRIILSHDPWVMAGDLKSWLIEYKRLKLEKTIILNTKEDGLEEQALFLMRQMEISDFFFLDTALPTLVRWVRRGCRNFAVRMSSMEPPELAQQFAGLVDWLWVDCFDGVAPSCGKLLEFSNVFKTCLVSPELQGLSINAVDSFRALSPHIHAVCTKDPLFWLGRMNDRPRIRP